MRHDCGIENVVDWLCLLYSIADDEPRSYAIDFWPVAAIVLKNMDDLVGL